jgi:hypothetical protein
MRKFSHLHPISNPDYLGNCRFFRHFPGKTASTASPWRRKKIRILQIVLLFFAKDVYLE